MQNKHHRSYWEKPEITDWEDAYRDYGETREDERQIFAGFGFPGIGFGFGFPVLVSALRFFAFPAAASPANDSRNHFQQTGVTLSSSNHRQSGGYFLKQFF